MESVKRLLSEGLEGKNNVFIPILYAVPLFALAVYSYSQIDLNLTLSSNNIYQTFQNSMIGLGYYNRPLSAVIFTITVLTVFLWQIILIYRWKNISWDTLKLLITLSLIILFFSYPGFSHDIFNYMFDARILTWYHQNPYVHSAMDFPADLWTRFMHWTHRTYPYGPFWLILSVFPSFIGMGKFILTLFNFKILFTIFHFGNIFLIQKIMKGIDEERTSLAVIVYALNPLILIESMVSPHNEVMMLFFLLLAMYLTFMHKPKILVLTSIIFSIAIKFATFPALILLWFDRQMLKILKPLQKLFLILLLMIPVLAVEIFMKEPYTWYFIPVIGMSALLCRYDWLNRMILIISLGLVLRYVPFLYFGDYKEQTISLREFFMVFPALLYSLIILGKIPVLKGRSGRSNRNK